jgi:hypothetical protein
VAGMMANVLMGKSAGLYPPMKGNSGTRKRKRKATVKATRKVRRVAKTTNKRARLVKGSAAAKAYMAKIRRKRRR